MEHGLTVSWLAGRTGKAVNTVKAYAKGYRIPPPEWLEQADAAIAAFLRDRDA